MCSAPTRGEAQNCLFATWGNPTAFFQKHSGEATTKPKVTEFPESSSALDPEFSLKLWRGLRSFVPPPGRERPGLRLRRTGGFLRLCGLLMVSLGENFALSFEPVLILVARSASPFLRQLIRALADLSCQVNRGTARRRRNLPNRRHRANFGHGEDLFVDWSGTGSLCFSHDRCSLGLISP